MPGSIYGNLFRVTTWGESHGKAVGAVVDGCPAGIPLEEKDIQAFLDRRRPGQSRYTTKRAESDAVEILSGVFEGRTTGTPISLVVRNEDQRSRDYSEIASYYRPGHADYGFDAKIRLPGLPGRRPFLGPRDHRTGGGGRRGHEASFCPGDPGKRLRRGDRRNPLRDRGPFPVRGKTLFTCLILKAARAGTGRRRGRHGPEGFRGRRRGLPGAPHAPRASGSPFSTSWTPAWERPFFPSAP